MQRGSLPGTLEGMAVPAGTGDERRALVRFFRMLLLLQTAYNLLIIPFVVLTDRDRLPPELHDYVGTVAFDRRFLVAAAVGCIVIAVVLAGLWHFRRWARLLYLLMAAFALLAVWWGGAPDVRSASASLAMDLALMFYGAALVLMWVVLRPEFGGPPYPLERPRTDR